MTDAKKLILLDPSNINRLADLFQTTNQRLQPLRTREIHELDTNMLKIINDKSLTDQEKVDKYNSTLAEFQTMSKVKIIPPAPKPEKNHTDRGDNNNTTSVQQELTGIPKTYHDKAKSLLRLLKSSPDVQVSENGEVTIGEKTIRGSNITDFLNKAVNPNAKIQSLAGWAQFQSVLKEGNIPQTLLSQKVNRELRNTPKKTKRTTLFKDSRSPVLTNLKYRSRAKKTNLKPLWSPY